MMDIDVILLVLICLSPAFVLGLLALLLTRRSAGPESRDGRPRPVRLARVAAWTVTVVCGSLIGPCLIFLLVAFLSSGNKIDKETAYGLAMLVSIGAFIFGSGILTVMPWLAGPAPYDGKSSGVRVVFESAWILALAGFVLGFFLFGPALVIVCIAIPVVVISMSFCKHVETQQYAMLALMGAAAKRSMPLDAALASFGQERGGWMRRRARAMVDQLLQGVPLPAAIEEVPGVLPPEAVPLVRVGHDAGALPAAIDKAVEAHVLFAPVWQTIIPKIGYVCILPSVAVGVVVFIFLKIVPQFEKIFKDFGVRLPAITRGIIEVGSFVGHWWFLVGAAWLFSIALLLYCMLRYAGWIGWDLPGTAWLTRRRHTAMLLDAIALAARQQQPLANAVMQLAAGYPRRSIARRFWSAYDDMQAGGGDLAVLHRHGLLGATDLALLESALRNGNLAWAAGELADSNRRRMIYRTNALVQVIFPPIIILYALAVAWIAAALFLPLVTLIQSLSGTL
jgi:type II secretory pathway component PulF